MGSQAWKLIDAALKLLFVSFLAGLCVGAAFGAAVGAYRVVSEAIFGG